ncbi:DNA alkylation repair protein [Streptomyces sp. H27-D2]|uniref:DNA alkylation repair protein n=1 Tax=Streptomyces sp. H27-D2 TaxID=3046304 RepID=UPI002DBA7156|nr:DNA alkylation repair protein [Streptomyces sp. H27-D2]MEC4019351.1 DNA alkylation repair protein [Streptomyces sp. H27-D2]
MPTADQLLSAKSVHGLIGCLTTVAPEQRLPLVRTSAAALDRLSLSERNRAVRDALLADLPADYESFAAIIGAALGDPEFTGWMIWPVTEAVAVRSLAPGADDRFDAGLDLLARLTSRLTGEFALRSFLEADLDRTLATVREWTTHPDENVRRLASEGTRPRLPWARRVAAILRSPGITVPVLDALYRDPSEYVRRSVANHLNDFSRTDSEITTTAAARWLEHPDEHTGKVVRHGLRTLVKSGDPEALRLLGFAPPAHIDLCGPVLHPTTLPLGGGLEFEFTLKNNGPDAVSLAVDYVIHHRKANGRTTPKVFKLTTRTLAPGASAAIARRHSFKPLSTRTYYPGEHTLEIQVNGTRFGTTTFELTPEPTGKR